MPTTDIPVPGRRLTARTRLRPPVEARLLLGAETLDGWIVDQQDDGLGLRLGSTDAERILRDPEPWRNGSLSLALVGLPSADERLPVRMVHVTPSPLGPRVCLVGLVYDRTRMKVEQVLSLLETWRRFESVRR